MKKILGEAKTIRQLLGGARYSVDYYQREYKWERKQVVELIEDLTSKFQDFHGEDHERQEVEKYGHYFLGSIIVSRKDAVSYIVDGQQRLTTLQLALAAVRRHIRPVDASPLTTVRSLAYFLPVIEEVLQMEVGEEYFQYIRQKLQRLRTS